jgi:predicted SAM-dependent methyltransferase
MDIIGTPAVDIICNMNNLYLESNSIEAVESYHVINMVTLNEARVCLKEWYRILKPEGKLIMELPDLIKCAKALLDGVRGQRSIWGFYGEQEPYNSITQPNMFVKYGYTCDTMYDELEKIGFKDIVCKNALTHLPDRDMRVEAIK